MDNNSEFGQLMQQAAAIKTEQVKADRRRFEGQPQFLQHTLFHCVDEKIVEMRNEEDVKKRIEFALNLKQEGNDFFKRNMWLDANDKYERVIGLFWYVNTSEPDWKNNGIKDEDLSYHEFEIENQEVRKLLSSAMNNIAAVQMEIKNWAECINCCEYAFEFDPKNIKAMYRCAKARTTPVSSGAVELDLALKDLKRALKVDPENKAVKQFYHRLSEIKKKQKALDEKTFTGMFERGELVPENKENEGGAENDLERKEAERKVEQQLEFYKDMSVQLKRKGREGDAAELDRVVQETQEKLKQQKEYRERPPIDYTNPTPQMIKDAKEMHGLDLTDPAVQQELTRLNALKAENPNAKIEDLINEEEDAKPRSNNLTYYIAAAIFGVSVVANLWFSTTQQ